MTPTITPKQQAEAVLWIEKPIRWAHKIAGEHFDPWSGQEMVWHEYGKLLGAKIKRYKQLPMTEEEKRYAKKLGISIMAGQGVGKGATISLMGLHYLFTLQKLRPKVICTAPAGPQLNSSLWPEYGSWLDRSELLGDIFEKNAKRIFLKADERHGEFMRIEPRTVQPNASPEEQKVMLAGVHALGVMYQIDEGSGVPEAAIEPLEGGLTDPLSMIILIFNPTRHDGFAMETHRKNREQWICLHWDGEDLAAEKRKPENYGRFKWFNEDQQETLAKKYGRESNFYRVRVRGLPPNQAGDSLIAFESVMAATTRYVETLPTDPLIVSADIGGPSRGGDDSVIDVLRGPRLLKQFVYQQKEPDQLANFVADHYSTYAADLPFDTQKIVGVDSNGIGRGVYSNLRNIHGYKEARPINTTEGAINPNRFHRLRDQIWWELAEAFMVHRDISLMMVDKQGFPVVDEDLNGLIAELTTIKWAEVYGKIKIQGKGESSGISHVPPLAHSPDKADALAMAWYLFKHWTSKIPPALRAQRKQRQMHHHPAFAGFRSIRTRMSR